MNLEEEKRNVHMNAFTTYGNYISKQTPIKNELDGLKQVLALARDKVNAASDAYKEADKEFVIALNEHDDYVNAKRVYDYAATAFASASEKWDKFVVDRNDEEEANE